MHRVTTQGHPISWPKKFPYKEEEKNKPQNILPRKEPKLFVSLIPRTQERQYYKNM